MTPDQVQRYSRHIIMPDVGSAGQRKLLGSSVLIIGAGGLGSPVAIYLALAGVGKIGIVDFDVVEISNLQRQILHQEKDIGRPKTESARETLLDYNPKLEVVIHEEPITSDNAMDIIPNYDVIVNGADNFHARYLLNDPSYLAGKPLVDGSIGVEGAEVTPNASKTVDATSRKMLEGEYDVAEMSLATFMGAAGPDSELLGLPVYPGRRFIHGGMLCRPDAGIHNPGDLVARLFSGGGQGLEGAFMQVCGDGDGEAGTPLDAR